MNFTDRSTSLSWYRFSNWINGNMNLRHHITCWSSVLSSVSLMNLETLSAITFGIYSSCSINVSAVSQIIDVAKKGLWLFWRWFECLWELITALRQEKYRWDPSVAPDQIWTFLSYPVAPKLFCYWSHSKKIYLSFKLKTCYFFQKRLEMIF